MSAKIATNARRIARRDPREHADYEKSSLGRDCGCGGGAGWRLGHGFSWGQIKDGTALSLSLTLARTTLTRLPLGNLH